ncbi:MAG: aminoacyl-tRNA hydrolase [Bacteroidales bacterium]|nr:aminoacyl-tRNA hydrolase [Bacteroidales bacterium]
MDVFYLYPMRECLKKEVSYKTSRSSGPGGQHVNKTESRVELYWNLTDSVCLNDFQKHMIRKRLVSRLTEKSVLILTSDKHRSQHQNKEDVTERFLKLIAASLVPVRKRYPTKPTRSSVEKRISNKKIRGDLKRSRRNRPEE